MLKEEEGRDSVQIWVNRLATERKLTDEDEVGGDTR